MITLTLPFPPSANAYWRHVGNRVYRTQEATIYKEMVGWHCREKGIEPIVGPVKVKMGFYFSSKRGDLDNRIKIALDSMQGYAYANDSQIVEIHARRFEDKSKPCLVVQIAEDYYEAV